MPFFESGGIQFHYLDRGEGLPFLFQHGLGGDVDQPAGFFDDPFPFRLLSLDCRGHGATRSPGDPARLSFAAFAGDVRALLDHLEVERAAVGGISMGAGVALAFARRHPERVSTLVLVRPAWLDEPYPPNLAIYPRISRLIRRHGAAKGRELFMQTDDYRAALSASASTAGSLLGQFDRPGAEEAAAVLECLPNDAPTRSRDEWTAIRVPVLVLANRRDPVHPFEYGRILAEAIPGAVFKEIRSKADGEQRHRRDVQEAIAGFFGGLPAVP